MNLTHKAVDLEVTVAGIPLKNPVMVASGTFGYGEELYSLLDIDMLGAVVTKGISLNPSQGNPPPRIVETPSGMLNSIGLQNIGLEKFISEKMPFLRQFHTPVIVNFFGSTIDEYKQLAERLDGVEGIYGLEVNISCPNIKHGGMCFGTEPDIAFRLVREVRLSTSLPLIVKLSPNVGDISRIAKSTEDAGADALSVANTFTGMAVDIDTCMPALANITGGLSGPAIRPLTLRMVWEVIKSVSIPVIGVGGIISAEDALQYLISGACAIQVGTALFCNPEAPLRIIEGLSSYLVSKGYSSIQNVIGSLRVKRNKES